MMSVDDLGGCVKTVFGDLDEYKGKTLALSAGKAKMEEVAAILAKHLEEKVSQGSVSGYCCNPEKSHGEGKEEERKRQEERRGTNFTY